MTPKKLVLLPFQVSHLKKEEKLINKIQIFLFLMSSSSFPLCNTDIMDTSFCIVTTYRAHSLHLHISTKSDTNCLERSSSFPARDLCRHTLVSTWYTQAFHSPHTSPKCDKKKKKKKNAQRMAYFLYAPRCFRLVLRISFMHHRRS